MPSIFDEILMMGLLGRFEAITRRGRYACFTKASDISKSLYGLLVLSIDGLTSLFCLKPFNLSVMSA